MTDYWDLGYNHYYNLTVGHYYADPFTRADQLGFTNDNRLDFAKGGMAALDGWREVLTDRNGIIRHLEAK